MQYASDNVRNQNGGSKFVIICAKIAESRGSPVYGTSDAV